MTAKVKGADTIEEGFANEVVVVVVSAASDIDNNSKADSEFSLFRIVSAPPDSTLSTDGDLMTWAGRIGLSTSS